MRRGPAAVVRAWQRFWFEPQPTSTLGIYRIGFGLLMIVWTVALLPDLQTFFGPNSIQPKPPFQPGIGWWGILDSIDTSWAVTTVWISLLVASIALCFGFLTRLASILVFVCVISFQHRAGSIFNAGDTLLRISAFFLMFAPAGASLSVDRWLRHRDRFWEFPARAPWALRLIQIQLSVLYLCSVGEKLRGAPWRDGTAFGLSLGLQDLWRFPLPGVVTHSLLISTVMTYVTLVVEFMIGVLVWNRAARPIVLLLGVGLHLSITVTLNVTPFSEVVLVTYLVWLSPAFAADLALAVRRRLERRPRLQPSTEGLATAMSAPPQPHP